VGEKSGMDALYATLPIKRSHVVLGRYLFFLAFDIFFGFIACIILAGLQRIMSRVFDIKETLLLIIVMLMIYSIVQAIQLPLYFKLGYTKAKFLVYIPLAVFPLSIGLLSPIFAEDLMPALVVIIGWIMENQVLTAGICLALWGMIIFTSYKLSLSFYKKRDF